MLLLCIFKHLPKCHLYYFQTLRLFGDSLDANELSKKDYLNQHSEWQKAYRLHAQHTASSFPVSRYLPKSRVYTQSKKPFIFVTAGHSYSPLKDLNLLDLRKFWFPWLLCCSSATHSTHTFFVPKNSPWSLLYSARWSCFSPSHTFLGLWHR